MRRIFLAGLVALALSAGGGAAAVAAPGDHGNACPPNSPAGGGDPACGKERPAPPPEETCPPATGPISGGLIQPLSDAIREGGGAALADLIDDINCQLIQGTLGL